MNSFKSALICLQFVYIQFTIHLFYLENQIIDLNKFKYQKIKNNEQRK